MGYSTFIINRLQQAKDPDTENALDEIKSKVQDAFSYGTSAPDRNTSGYIYFQLGATTATAVKIYIKDKDGNWNGG